MKIGTRVLAVGSLVAAVLASGCAKPDWIQQTLVTVDVTGTWVRTDGPPAELKLEQRGPKVTGSIRARAAWYGSVSTSGTLEGSVSGDVFQFKQTSGSPALIQGKKRVSGDEMTVLSGPLWGVLRRVDASTQPTSQP